MLNYIWSFMIIISIISAIITDRMGDLSNSILNGSQEAVNLTIYTLGIMSLWTGLMRIADCGGITNIISKIFRPILKILFPDYTPESKVSKAICMNLTANMLGLGNAATPFGISAMKEMQKCNKNKSTASRGMIMFVAINTTSLQIIPTFIAALRQKNGSIKPFSIFPELWITAFCGLIVTIVSVKVFEKVSNKK